MDFNNGITLMKRSNCSFKHSNRVMNSFFAAFFKRFLMISVMYDHVQDIINKRNPRLVPYNLLDEKTKKTNRDTVCAAVRTLIGYGYNIEPPDQESSECSESRTRTKFSMQ